MSNDASSVGSTFTVRKVAKANRSQFSSVLQEAARALEGRNQPLWSQADLTSEALGTVYPQAEMVLGMLEGEAVAGMVLLEEDLLFWPEVTENESLFIHKLAVVPKAQGQGVAARMLRFASTRARELGKRYLRLDCAAERPKLRAFYEDYGFSYVGACQVGQFSAALYEQEIIW